MKKLCALWADEKPDQFLQHTIVAGTAGVQALCLRKILCGFLVCRTTGNRKVGNNRPVEAIEKTTELNLTDIGGLFYAKRLKERQSCIVA